MRFKNRKIQYIVDLILELAKKELKVRYKNSILGYLWSILSPLSLAIVFFVAFKIFMRLKIENYVLFLITGLFSWQWFTNSVYASTNLFLNNATLIKKIKFPKDSLIYSMVLNDLVHFVLATPVIFLFILIYRQKISLYLILFPFVVVLQYLFISGICLIVSSINLFFRDLERLVVVFTNLLFYLTPIIYSPEMVPQRYRIFLLFNPMSNFVILYRNMFIFDRIQFEIMIATLIFSIMIFLIGQSVYKILEWRFAEVV